MQKKVEKCQNRHFTASKIPKYSSNPTMIGQDTVKEVSRSYSNVSILFTPSTLPESWFRKWTFYGIYVPCQFSWWSLNVFKIKLISAEIRIFESRTLKIMVQMQQVNDIFCSARKMLQMIIGVLKYTIYTEAAPMCWCYHFIILLEQKFWYFKQENCYIWHSQKFRVTTFHPTHLVWWKILNSENDESFIKGKC